MKTDLLAHYIKSVEAQKAGRTVEAESHLAASLGLKSCTPIMKANIKQLTNGEKPNIAVVTLLVDKMRRGE